MLNVWEKSKMDLYFEDEELDGYVRQGFSHLIEKATPEEIGAFVQAIHSLHDLPVSHAIVTDSQRYVF